VELEVLGCSCGRPSGGVAASGYLVRDGETCVLLDCGPGIATELTSRALTEINGIYISHGHYDHCADLLTLGLCLIMSRDLPEGFRIPLYLPVGLAAPLAEVARVFPYHDGKHSNPYEHVFTVHEYAIGEQIKVGSLTLTPCGPNDHPAPACAVRVSNGKQVLGYSGDSHIAPSLFEAAKDADLFLCESITQTYSDPAQTRRTHLSAEQAGQVAQESGTRALMITHLTQHSAEWKSKLLATATEQFKGPIAVAAAGQRYSVAPFAHLGPRS
jgi:ribonuclease BN (tRNA processing enzyme)